MNIATIINSWKTVFTVQDMCFLLNMKSVQSVRNYMSKLGRQGILRSLAYGIWGLHRYNIFELAGKLKKKSYISLETVLYRGGIIYQEYGQTIFSVSDDTMSREADGYIFKYHRITDKILLDPIWVENKGSFMMASIERAICDKIYLSASSSFDNLEHISWEKLERIAQIYPARVRLAVSRLHHAS